MSKSQPSERGRRPLRAAGCSGSASDRRDALARLASRTDLDFIFGDWMSEYNMTGRAADAADGTNVAWEPTLMTALQPALEALAANKIKFACNAGASDTVGLAKLVQRTVAEKGLNLTVAWISGDEVWEDLKDDLKNNPKRYDSLTMGKSLKDWGFEPFYAQAYLGGFGIAAALENGADIVICGRVADASPLIGAAAWWHSWSHDSLDGLAGAFVAGHLTECSCYVTGGNFSGFKILEGNWSNIGYPLVDIASDGSAVIKLEPGTDGIVNVATCTAQLLYEIQGPLYYNSDVVADLRTVQFEQVGPNEVRMFGVKGLRPPPTTKVGLTARGGFQAEAHYYLCGLDIAEKAKNVEDQIRSYLPTIKDMSLLKFTITGTPGVNPSSQDAATVELRIFAQAMQAQTLNPLLFFRLISDQIMQVSPGATLRLDPRLAVPKPFYEYFVTIMPQSLIKHQVHFLDSDKVLNIDPPKNTSPFLLDQESQDVQKRVSLESFGKTKTGPLGLIVHARSGDKGSDSNVGFFVRHEDEYDWLCNLLTVDKMKALLELDYNGKRIDRLELPHLKAVHFLLKDHLDRGVSSSSTYDVLGKNLAEYLRCKFVDLPEKFLLRGTI